jgi:RAT1-interacting protein
MKIKKFRNEFFFFILRFTFDFVAWRGTIRKIMSSLFNNETDWRIGVIHYRGTYFLHVFHTETELSIEFGQTPTEKRMCYWGHKFEDYLCFGKS